MSGAARVVSLAPPSGFGTVIFFEEVQPGRTTTGGGEKAARTSARTSGVFRRPPASSLLRYIVEETLAGRGNELKEYTLGVAVLGRGSQFDPRLDSIVRVQASKLRARLAAYYKVPELNDSILIELPRGSYEPRIVPHGFRGRRSPSRAYRRRTARS